MVMTMLTRTAAEKNRTVRRFFGGSRRVDTCMTYIDHPVLNETVRRIVDGPHLSVLATTDADGKAQTSVIFVKRDGDHILFSTIKGRRKTTNMGHEPRVNLLVQGLPVLGPNYATISGIAELTDDPDGSFHQEMYDIHMGGATPPPEPGAERVIVRIVPRQVYLPPAYDLGSDAVGTEDEQRAQRS
jgi:PPOX class probable F420-dependent enzyme